MRLDGPKSTRVLEFSKLNSKIQLSNVGNSESQNKAFLLHSADHCEQKYLFFMTSKDEIDIWYEIWRYEELSNDELNNLEMLDLITEDETICPNER